MAGTKKNTTVCAWLEWTESEEGKRAIDGGTLSIPPKLQVYLENRLWHAFMAGIRAEREASGGSR